MIKSNYEVEVLVDGHSVKEYYKNGKHFIEARKGKNFSLRVKNNGYTRILIVPSVDGLSVMNGKKASLQSGGYIVNGYSSITIDGWRTSDSDVAKFVFTNPSNSYAEKMDRAGDLGVIGVAIFREKQKPVHISPSYFPKYPGQFNFKNADFSLRASANFVACSASNMSQDVGTGFGETKASNVTKISFEEESSPDAIFEIFYNTRKQLESIGIDFKEVQYIAPRAFPGEYCERPN